MIGRGTQTHEQRESPVSEGYIAEKPIPSNERCHEDEAIQHGHGLAGNA